MQEDFDKHKAQRKLDGEGNLLNPIRLDGFKPTDEESIGKQLQKIAKEKDSKGEYRRIGEIHGFPILESHRKLALPAKTLLKTLGG